MSAFEFFFGFYGLILGLAVVEVVSGFAKSLRARDRVKLGLCTPLLALFILLDLIQFWSDTWAGYQNVAVNAAVLTVALAIAAIYYLAASLIFPDRLEEWETIDAYYDGHKRLVFGASVLANLIGVYILPLISGQQEELRQALSPASLIFIALWTTPMAVICLVKNRLVNAALLAILCAVYLVATFGQAIAAL